MSTIMRPVSGFLTMVAVLFLAACGTGRPAPVQSYGIDGGANSAGVHTVANGDTVWNIAERYRIDMKDIIYVNNLQAPYFLEAGRRLTLPPPMTYRVREGDTLYGISQLFEISTAQLVAQNDLKAPYRVRRGDTLRLPSVRPVYKEKPAIRELQVAGVESSPLSPPPSIPRVDGPEVMPQRVARVEAVLPIPTQTPPRESADGKMAWPVSGPVLMRYGPKKDGLHNDGINIKAPKGAPVRAAENGVVVYADNQLSGFGNLVLVRHQDRWVTAYAHLDKTMVRKGQEVRRGETLGTVGKSGNVDSPQLHFEVRRGTEALNPEAYLARQGS